MLCFYCTQTHTKLQCELSREFFKTIFARLPPLASAARCGPHPPQPLATPLGTMRKCGGMFVVWLSARRGRAGGGATRGQESDLRHTRGQVNLTSTYTKTQRQQSGERQHITLQRSLTVKTKAMTICVKHLHINDMTSKYSYMTTRYLKMLFRLLICHCSLVVWYE